ncbi:MAG: sulfite exporter TauE/SafE family protein [Galactobacter sp.]
MSTSILAITVLLLVVGAISQRVAGLGFAMVASPFLVLVLGPHQGVVLTNVCGVASSCLVIFSVFRFIEWRKFTWLLIPALVGSFVGSWGAAVLPSGPLGILVGGTVLLALVLSSLLAWRGYRLQGTGPQRGVTGFFAGLSNSLSGVGGPVLTAYAELTQWPQRHFAAMLQPFFIVTGIFSAATKVWMDPSTWPHFDAWQWAVLLAAVVSGVWIGNVVAPHVKDYIARRIVLALAVIGSVMAVVKGITDLA